MPKLSKSELKILQEVERQNAEMQVTQRIAVPRVQLGFEKNVSDIQRQLIADTSRKILCCAGRRGGKTFAILAKMLKVALSKKDALCWAIAPSRERVKLIYWQALKKVNEQYRLGARFNDSELSAVFPTRSAIRLTGIDDIHDTNKFRGSPADLYCIDEAASYRNNILTYLIDESIVPAAEDFLDAQIILAGTPGNTRSGYFHDADRRNNPASEWSSYHWNVTANPYFERWRGLPDWQAKAVEYLATMRAQRGWSETNPLYRREWLAEWDADDTSFYYSEFDAGRNIIQRDAIPAGLKYVIGGDFGSRVDPTAFVVLAYNENISSNCYVVDARKILSPTRAESICHQLHQLVDEYIPEAVIGDYAAGGTYLFDQMSERYGVHVDDAQKKKKSSTTDNIINSEFHEGRILVASHLMDLIGELQTIRWDADRKKPDPSYPNDLCDAFQYGYTEVYSHLYKPPAPKLTREQLIKRELDDYWAEQDRLVEDQEPWIF